MTPSRIDRLRARLAEVGAPAAVVTSPLNVGYLSGFSGSLAALVVTPRDAVFITDSRYTLQAQRECPGLEIVITPSSGRYADAIAEQVKRLGLSEAAVEADTMTIQALEELQKRVNGTQLRPVADLASPLRRVKDAGEIATIQEACALSDRGFEYALTLLRPGVSEREVALELDFHMRRIGSEREPFETIVVSGPRTAMPHGHPSGRPLEAGDFITFDFGARLKGYMSDLTRTVVLGKASERQREIYGVVLEANRTAVAAIRPGADGKAVDAVARDLIAARGFGEYFGHGLGHGLGRTVHDHVALSTTSELTLEVGMVLTVEPGIYVPEFGGVRIEDDVVVTEDGCEVLTLAPRELIEVPI